uniref:chemotaxis protein CheB n=1 Tax=Paenibacillus xylanexedens TaxID=528191 RepID=UPI0028CB6918
QVRGDLGGGVIIVEHMGRNLRGWVGEGLNRLSGLDVVEGEEGMVLKKGSVYIGPGGLDVKVKKRAEGKFMLKVSEDEGVKGDRG